MEMEGAPRSAVFSAPPQGATASSTIARATDYFIVHGMYYRIPPLFDELHLLRDEVTAGFSSYTQWAKSCRPHQPSQVGGAVRAATPASRGSLSSLRRPACASAANGEDQLSENEKEDLDRWKRCYSAVVKRDVPRQQKSLSAQSREVVAASKRTVTAAQKEVRRRAMRAQRMASGSQVQLRCKKLSRELQLAYKAVEARLLAGRKNEARAVWVGNLAPSSRVQNVERPHLQQPQAKRARRTQSEAALDVTLVRVPLDTWQRRLTDSLHAQLYLLSTTSGDCTAVPSSADSLALLTQQTKLLLDLRKVSAHPRLFATPPSPMAVLPPHQITSGSTTAPGGDREFLEVVFGSPALCCVVPAVAWFMCRALDEIIIDSETIVHKHEQAVKHVLRLNAQPIWLLLCRKASEICTASSTWRGMPSMWKLLLLLQQALVHQKQRRMLSFVYPRAIAWTPVLISPCYAPSTSHIQPATYMTRRMARFNQANSCWLASFRQHLEAAFTEICEEGPCLAPSALPALSMEALLLESSKLRHTDAIIRRAASHPGSRVVVFCHCQSAAELLLRLFTYRRYAHTYIPDVLTPEQRATRVNATRHALSHVLLYQGGPPTQMALTNTAVVIFYDAGPALSQTVYHVRNAAGNDKTSSTRLLFLVSADRCGAVGELDQMHGWEEKAVRMCTDPPLPIHQVTAELIDAERSRAANKQLIGPYGVALSRETRERCTESRATAA
ncbi:hypothetical protein AB1Y20_016862 [Prymnesium parvum]|uniref:DBINO domain-containing protein n=1 Tax=Prymnesium parvum TaxID=97485 RepID=A0AB34IB06_PRYPA